MSNGLVLVEPEPILEDASRRGEQFYLIVCLAAAVGMALPLLARGMGEGALLPALVGLMLPLVRWRSGVILLLLAVGWTLFADHLGVDPFTLLGRVLNALLSLFFLLPPRLRTGFSTMSRLQHPQPFLDILFCAAVALWIASYFRLLSVTRNIFPIDRRRRGPAPARTRKRGVTRGPVLELKRAGSLVDGQEVVKLVLATGLCAVLAQVMWRWVRRRVASVDLSALAPFGVDLRMPSGLWQLFVVTLVFAVVLIVMTGLMAYLGQRRLTPAEAALYLQDQLWRETRREQARLNRYLAWAEKREAKRAARRRGGK